MLVEYVKIEASAHADASYLEAELLGVAQHVYLAGMVAYVGIDPRKDVTFVFASGGGGEATARRGLVDRGFTPGYEYAVQTIKERPYDEWRLWDPAGTLRFYALCLHEAGMIKTSPRRSIGQGTDRRFLNQLKRELKG